MKQVPVKTTSGFVFALVDDDDFNLVSQCKWYISNGYAINAVGQKMHRLIKGVTGCEEIDHRKGNRLDNRKGQLRTCTRSENAKNCLISKNNTSGYKGVWWNKKLQKWQAYIMSDRKRVMIGHYGAPEEAAFAYDLKAIELHGEYAAINGHTVIDTPQAKVDRLRYIRIQKARLEGKTPEQVLLAKETIGAIKTALDQKLTDREREIVKLRFGFDGFNYTLAEIGRIFKLSRSRVGQVLMKAMEKLEKALLLENVANSLII